MIVSSPSVHLLGGRAITPELLDHRLVHLQLVDDRLQHLLLGRLPARIRLRGRLVPDPAERVLPVLRARRSVHVNLISLLAKFNISISFLSFPEILRLSQNRFISIDLRALLIIFN